MNKRNAGFSLTEMLVVVAVMGIIVGGAATKLRTGADDTAYQNAMHAVVALARATSLAACSNTTHKCYFLIDTTTSTNRYVRGWVDVNDNATYDDPATDILVGEYHLIDGSFMNITTTIPGPSTVTWTFLPTGTATTTGSGTLILCASVSKTNPANAYTSTSPTKFTTITLTTSTNRTRECYQAFDCP